MRKALTFHVGQAVVAVYSERKREPEVRDAIVTKIGRRWISFETTSGGYSYADRFDAENREIDNGGIGCSPGKVYLSRHAYEMANRKEAAWASVREFCRDNYRPPAGLTTEQVEMLARVIKGGDRAS